MPEALGSEAEMDAPDESVVEIVPEAESAEVLSEETVGDTIASDAPSQAPASEAGVAETPAAETDDLHEISEPPEQEGAAEVDAELEDPATEPEPVDGIPAEPATEPEEKVTEPDDTAIEPDTAGAATEEKSEAAEKVMAGEPAGVSAPSPAAPGTRISDRFELVEMLDAADNEVLYRAEDLSGCLQCDFEGNTPDDAFCGHCGAALEERPSVHLLETLDAEAEPSSGQKVADRLTHESRTFLLLAKDPVEPEAPRMPKALRLIVGHSTDVGQVRGLNEDSLLVMTLASTYESETGPVLGLFAVADGMGGHQGGEIASRLALEVLSSQVVQHIILPELANQPASPEGVVELLRQATVAANDAVFLDRQKRENDMGTTLTTALVRNQHLFLAHVGDCRAYRWNADGLVQLTTDHSLVASMIASGQAEPDEIYTHPHRSVIHRCIGDQPLVDVDADLLSLAPGDRIIVCSDGLWEMVRSEGIEEVMLREPDPQAACELLVSHANMAGGDDNISVIVVQVGA
jgi:serine/threonine protein phosphatase PrpC